MSYKLFTSGKANPKIAKSDNSGKGYLTIILHLAPANKSGYEVCPFASVGCRASCLNTSGHGRYQKTQNCRIRRTKLFFENRELFESLVISDIQALIRKCNRENMLPAVRLNGTSDIAFERVWPELFKMFPQVQFYDYTKNPTRMGGKLPENYHLTFSRSESNDRIARNLIQLGKPVAVVFDSLPNKFCGRKVFNADNTDLRFLDPRNQVIGLIPKGRGKRDKSGFVVRQ